MQRSAEKTRVYNGINLFMARGKNFLQKIADILLLATVFIAPLKLGGMLLPGVPGVFPTNVLELVIQIAPPMAFALLAALLLIVQLAAYAVPENFTLKNPQIKLLLLWLILPLTALIGFINASSLESAVVEFEYTLALAAFAASAALNLTANGKIMQDKLLNTMVWSTMLTALLGANQYFFGFDEMKEYIELQEKVYHVKITPEIKARALDVRTYATFTFASALAAMFCLTGALSVVKAYFAGERVEPARVSRSLFGGVTLLLVGGIFLTTKGRSAFLAMIVAAAVCGFVKLKSARIKLLVAVAGAICIIAGAFYIHYAGRGFGSMTERVGYLKSCAEMFCNHPLLGDGWGDFTFHHAVNKSFGNEELAKDPHNFVAAFASQTGVIGGIIALLMLFYPLWLSGRKAGKNNDLVQLSIFAGLSAFSLHILMDLDWQVPALMIWYAVLAMIAVAEFEGEKAAATTAVGKKIWCSALVLLALIALLGAGHWCIADQTHSEFLRAAGQEIGVNNTMRGVYEVDALAEKSLRWQPYSHSIYASWALDAVRRGNYPVAEKRYLTALKMVPRSHALHERLGDLYELQGNSSKAAEFHAEADRLFPYKKIFFEKRGGKVPAPAAGSY